MRVLQDLAWLTVQYRTLNRGAELSSLRTENTAFGPNMCCVVFQICFSKVLQGGSVHEFGVSARPGDPTCRYVQCGSTFNSRGKSLGGCGARVATLFSLPYGEWG
jgi:hypothetical protein